MQDILTKKQETLSAYNTHAQAYSDKYDKLDRTKDITRLISYIASPNPDVFEIGCGTGRDAMEFSKYTNRYLGIDISEEFINIASQRYPFLKFQIADIEECSIPDNLDIIYTSASLVHLDLNSLKSVLDKAYHSLKPGGVFHLSMIGADAYTEISETNELGTRHFHLYSESDVKKLAGKFKIIHTEWLVLNNRNWLDITLQKS